MHLCVDISIHINISSFLKLILWALPEPCSASGQLFQLAHAEDLYQRRHHLLNQTLGRTVSGGCSHDNNMGIMTCNVASMV